ncbi:M20/M25/M40 family metallo-hydrolase [Kiritimatiellota bacterium B12222]|nr:M20/M25/M40 family metallo-hydrolase [Kiritimatiellota bacterium B12222]
MSHPHLDLAHAEQTLLDLLKIPGLSGRERQVADHLISELKIAGVDAQWIFEDDAHTRIGRDFEMGNLIVKLPGTSEGPRLMFSGHMDTVPLVRGVQPKKEGNRFVSQGDTALGADNRTACAAILTLVQTLLNNDKPYPPMTLLFTVGEEIGLFGAKEVKMSDLGNPEWGFNIDSGDPARAIIGAIGAHRWQVGVKGISAHAGVHPDHGVSAALIAARAITEISEKGYFGLIEKDGKKGTSNVGVIAGGEASNQVTDFVKVTGESRSHDPEFLTEITENVLLAFENAAASVQDNRGRTGVINFNFQADYHAFRMEEDHPVVQATSKALAKLGITCLPEVTNGGLDANFLNVKGIPTVTLGAGQHNPHTVDEYADIPEYLTCCELLLQIVEDAVAR